MPQKTQTLIFNMSMAWLCAEYRKLSDMLFHSELLNDQWNNYQFNKFTQKTLRLNMHYLE